MSSDQDKELIKQALQEWLDKKYTDLGKWVGKRFAILMILVIFYLFFQFYGWRLPL